MKINLKILDPGLLIPTHNVVIQRTGKMGFTKKCAYFLGIPNSKTANILLDESLKNNNKIYLEIFNDNQGLLKIKKAGNYYYIKTKEVFDYLKLNYSNGGLSYRLNKIEINDKIYFELTKNSL